jgi:hypothetical protein
MVTNLIPTMGTACPALPEPRGPWSGAVIGALARDGSVPELEEEPADPYGEDLQLALYVCYELHYQSFSGVSDRWEWDPELLRLRARMESAFLGALRADVSSGDDVEAALAGLLTERADDWGVSHHLAADGTLAQFREYVAHRSLYHLKEADPQAWVIPRLQGQAKASLVTVEHDEYGAGRAERLHARLFADMMAELGLDPEYGAYLDRAPAQVLATVNLMSVLGLHRSLRGALVGQFAAVEITSSPGSARLARAARRLGAGPASERFYLEHVEADAVHEQLVRHGVIGALLAAEPEQAAAVTFGARAYGWLEGRLASYLLECWQAGQSSLRDSPPRRTFCR